MVVGSIFADFQFSHFYQLLICSTDNDTLSTSSQKLYFLSYSTTVRKYAILLTFKVKDLNSDYIVVPLDNVWLYFRAGCSVEKLPYFENER